MDASLPPDQQAVLNLLVKQGRGYQEIAELLGMEPVAVRRRAHLALTTLAGPAPGTVERRAELADHVLGQQEPVERRATARSLRGAEDDRDWIEEAAESLGIDAPQAAPARTRPAPAPKRSRTRSAPRRPKLPRLPGLGRLPRRPVLIAALVAVVAAVGVTLALTVFDSDDSPEAAAPTTSTQASVQPEAQSALEAPGGAESPAGALVFGRIGTGRQVVAMQAQGLRASTESAQYVLWLERAEGAPLPVAFLPAVAEDGNLTFQAELQDPIALGDYRAVFVTRERAAGENQAAPTEPGTRLLTGTLATPSAG